MSSPPPTKRLRREYGRAYSSTQQQHLLIIFSSCAMALKPKFFSVKRAFLEMLGGVVNFIMALGIDDCRRATHTSTTILIQLLLVMQRLANIFPAERRTLAKYILMPNTLFQQRILKFLLNVQKLIVPYGITSIGYHAFKACSSLATITIPASVTSIGNCAFHGCSSLAEVIIPDSVTSIGDSAFYGCSSLTEVIIPDSVTSIGDSAFQGCYMIAS